MNEKIANIIKTNIEGLAFVDKIAGLVRPMRFEIVNPDGSKIIKVLPVSCDITAEQCTNGNYLDLVPDAKYMSIIYFEDNGTTLMAKNDNWTYFNSRLTLVAWLNLKKINCECTDSYNIILSMLAILPEFPIQSDIIREIRIVAVSEVPKTPSIFGKYTYNEITSQYLVYPYDYFALNISVDYRIKLDCISPLELNPCDCV